jgi:hypothetical protein
MIKKTGELPDRQIMGLLEIIAAKTAYHDLVIDGLPVFTYSEIITEALSRFRLYKKIVNANDEYSSTTGE